MFKDAKQTLRQTVLARRDGLTPEWRAQASQALARHGQAALDLSAGMVVAGFLPIRSEVDPRPLMAGLHTQGARLCLPAILDRETIVFRQYHPDMKLVEMALKTQGPGPEAPELLPDVILLPLAGFDAMGNRLGYGAGFYDRAIAKMAAQGHHPRLIGLAFAIQSLPQIPAEPHDRPIEAILTEDGLTPLGPLA